MGHTIVKAKVNSETIKGLDDEQLEALVYEKASQLDSGTFGERFTRSEGHILLCAIYATAILDGEVCNGGFDQFFYQNGRLLPFALEGLKHIGAVAHADLLARAAKVYEEYGGVPDENDAEDGGRIHELDPLDDEYYALESTYELRVQFVRANIEKFVD